MSVKQADTRPPTDALHQDSQKSPEASPRLPTAPPGNSPPQYPELPTPQSNNSDNGLLPGGTGTTAASRDHKRPRACEACRGLKVRCDPVEDKPDGPCKRCARAGRNCVIIKASRKRQKKADTRVAELEKKIDALTATLQGVDRNASISEGNSPADERFSEIIKQCSSDRLLHGGIETSEWLLPSARRTTTPSTALDVMARVVQPAIAAAGQKRRRSEEGTNSSSHASAASDSPKVSISSSRRLAEKSVSRGDEVSNIYPYLVPKSSKPATPQPAEGTTPSALINNAVYEYTDAIDRRVLSAETAADLFDRYTNQMAPLFPAVTFPFGTTASEIRKTKPTLFLAILSVSSAVSHPDIQPILTKEVMRVYADKIICNGEKTLELLQALHVSTIWYTPPEHYEELKFYQLVHISAILAIDLGLSKRAKYHRAKHGFPGIWRDSPIRRHPLNTDTVESRRAWLCCFYLASHVSMALRRPNLIRWTSYMGECLDVLESSPDASHSDRLLCQWVRVQHIADEVGLEFSMDDPTASAPISDTKVQFSLKGFERQLEEWKSQLTDSLKCISLDFCANITNLYMHEIAMHSDHNVDDFQPPFSEEVLRKGVGHPEGTLTRYHVNALSTCLTSIHGVFDTFLSFGPETMRILPVFNFVRVAYAVVVLIKMHSASIAPRSELGKVFRPEDLKVEYYLDLLLDRFRIAAQDDKSKAASKFSMILVMFKTWFQRQKSAKGGCTGRPVKLIQSVALLGMVPPPCRQHEVDHPDTEIDAKTRFSPIADGDSPIIGRNGEDRTMMQSSFESVSTPLQVLSEVAMGNPNVMLDPSSTGSLQGGWIANSASNAALPGNPGMISQQQSQMLSDGNNQTGQPFALLNGNFAPVIPEASDSPNNLAPQDDDFSQYFLDDGFFNTIMGDGVPNIFEHWQ
ncbi:MAG: hypothetical protein M1829_001029 [Trizodia sp. TS-e1964]|nr:MAG: hypothetical protein M1829_001029 [Trizodia sp. TS-e1964]